MIATKLILRQKSFLKSISTTTILTNKTNQTTNKQKMRMNQKQIYILIHISQSSHVQLIIRLNIQQYPQRPMEIKKLNVEDYVLQLNEPLLLKHKFSQKILTANPDFKALCSILSTREQFYALLESSHLILNQPDLIVQFKLGFLSKSISIQFETLQRDFSEQKKDLLNIIGRLKKQSNAKSSQIASLKNSLEYQIEAVKKLQNYKQQIKEKFNEWNNTHCGGCCKEVVQKNCSKAYGRPTCSHECLQRVKNILGWKATMNIGL